MALVTNRSEQITDNPYPHPYTYEIVMHCGTAIQLPINILVIFCILTKTTDSMKNYGRLLLIHACWAAPTEIMFSNGALPFVFPPYIAGIPLGFLYHLGVSSRVQFAVTLLLMAGTGASMVHIFVYRESSLAKPNHPLRHKWIYRAVVTSVYAGCFGVTVYVSFIFIGRSMLNRIEKAKRIWKWVPSQLDDPRVVIVNTDFVDALHICTSFVIVSLFLASIVIGIFLTISSIYQMRQFASNVSERTARLQKEFQLAVSVQLCVYLSGLSIPGSVIVLNALFQAKSQNLVNSMLFCMSMNGTADALCVLIFVKPYRQAILAAIRKPYRQAILAAIRRILGLKPKIVEVTPCQSVHSDVSTPS